MKKMKNGIGAAALGVGGVITAVLLFFSWDCFGSAVGVFQ